MAKRNLRVEHPLFIRRTRRTYPIKDAANEVAAGKGKSTNPGGLREDLRELANTQ